MLLFSSPVKNLQASVWRSKNGSKEGGRSPRDRGALLDWRKYGSRPSSPSAPFRRTTVRTRLLCQPMGCQAPPRWLRRPIAGEPTERRGVVTFRGRVGLEGSRGAGWTVGQGIRPYLVFGAPPCEAGSCRASWRRTRSSRLCEGAARIRWREMNAGRKTHRHRRAKPERICKGKGDPSPRPSPTDPEMCWGPNFPSLEL